MISLRTRCSLFALFAALPLAPSCGGGTETDNPVLAGGPFESPEQFAPEEPVPPGCAPPDFEDEPNLPRDLPHSALLDDSFWLGGNYGGLRVLGDGGEVTSTPVRGTIHELLEAAPGELWVAAIEPPGLDQTELPEPALLEPELRLVQLDVSDPAAPARLAHVALSGEYFRMRARDGAVWVLTARRDASERGCDAQRNLCDYRSYEAVVLSGYRPGPNGLEQVASAELPYERRAWFGADGVVTLTPDGQLHVLRWDAAGALLAPQTVSVPGLPVSAEARADLSIGPAELAGSELMFVAAIDGRRSLFRVDLSAGSPSPTRVDLDAGDAQISTLSVLWEGKLFLHAPYGTAAQIWDISGEVPVALALPAEYGTLLPIEGASLEARPGALAAIGLARDPNTGAERHDLLAIEGMSVGLVQTLPEASRIGWYPGNHSAAPAGLRGNGDASSWQLVMRGAGLPLSVEPAAPPGAEPTSRVVAAAAPTSISGVTASIIESYAGEGVAPDPALAVDVAGERSLLELSPGATALVPTPSGVVVVADTQASHCAQSGRDCEGYVPGVAVFDLSNGAELVAELPFPELPFEAPSDPQQLSVSWTQYDSFSERGFVSQPLDTGAIGFAATVELSCTTEAECASLGLEPVPFAQAGVALGSIDCPPDGADPECVPGPAPEPAVYGQGRRQYFYALDLAAAEGPRWLAFGASALESVSGRPDQNSRFAAPRALGGRWVATRLERRASSGALLPRGEARFMMDRFELDGSGAPIALPPVNVPGYPAALVSLDGAAERWLTVEPLPEQAAGAHVHRLQVTGGAAAIEQSLELEDAFSGFVSVTASGTQFGVVLSEPENACGVSRLSVIELGARSADAPLGVASTLELPSNDWNLTVAEGDTVLLRRDRSYALVRVAADGASSLVKVKSTDLYLDTVQLHDGVLTGAAGEMGVVSFEL